MHHGCWRMIEAFERGLTSEARSRANHGWKREKKRERERERERERLQGMFYRDPTVGTKCTYQNLQLAHIKVDVAKMGSWISHVRLRVAFVRRTR